MFIKSSQTMQLNWVLFYVNYSSTEMGLKIIGICEFDIISYDFEILCLLIFGKR